MEASSHAGGPPRPLVVLGASVRSLAESACRAGWAVHAADLFRDLDLLPVTREAVRVTAEYPGGLMAAANGFPASAPWCYTGALENHPDLIDAIAAVRPLAGNPAALVRQLRNPALLATAVAAAGLAFPETHREPEGLPTDGTYLVKPLASAGGRGIRAWTADVAASWSARRGATDPPASVWQRCIEGTPLSAGYVMSAGSATLIGLTRQVIGARWCHAPRFAWCGGVTVGQPDLFARFERLGAALAAAFRPVGAVGVDAIVDAVGGVSVLEVNPRPTASMELLERRTGVSIAASHLAACGDAPRMPPACRPPNRETGWHWAKAVLFTALDLPVTALLLESLRHTTAAWTSADGGWASLADIPAAGQMLAAGTPACTFFARGRRPEDALDRLRRRVAAADRLLGTHRTGTAATP